MIYFVFKTAHLLGVILLIGNVTVTSVWKVFADRTGEPQTIRFAQKMVALTDWWLTCTAIGLVAVGGYGMVWVGGLSASEPGWIMWGQILFVLSGAIWLLILVPLQAAQSRLARTFRADAPVPAVYWHLGRLWLVFGVLATVPLIAAVYVMVARP